MRNHLYSLNMRSRSLRLDLLRIFAAFWVLIYHWSGRSGFYQSLPRKWDLSWWPKFLDPIAKTGFLGVDVFFILSGAVIAQSIQNQSDAFKFAEKRFLRLFPTYFLATVLALLIAPIVDHGIHVSADYLDLTGIQFWAGGWTIVGAAWTLPIEIGFYFLAFLWILLSNKLSASHSDQNVVNSEKGDILGCFSSKNLRNFLSVWLLIVVVAPALNVPQINLIFVTLYAPYFILGATIARLKLSGKVDSTTFLHLFLSLFLSFRTLNGRVKSSAEISHHSIVALLILSFVVGYLLCPIKKLNLSSTVSEMSLLFGSIALMTYPIYLLHDTVGLSLVSLATNRGLPTKLSYCLVFIFILLLSWTCVRWYEPFFKRKFRSLQD